MPYKRTPVDPELFLEHKGVKVYHTYEGGDFDHRTPYIFSTDERLTDDDDVDLAGDDCFIDIRNVKKWSSCGDFINAYLRDYPGGQHPPYPELEKQEFKELWLRWNNGGETKAITETVKSAIDAGLLKSPE